MLSHTYFTLLLYIVSSKLCLVLLICKLGNKLRFALATKYVLFIVSITIIAFIYLAKLLRGCRLESFCSTQTEFMGTLRETLSILKFLSFRGETCKFKDLKLQIC